MGRCTLSRNLDMRSRRSAPIAPRSCVLTRTTRLVRRSTVDGVSARLFHPQPPLPPAIHMHIWAATLDESTPQAWQEVRCSEASAASCTC